MLNITLKQLIDLNIYVCFLFVTFDIGMNFEYSPIPALFSFFTIIVYSVFNHRFKYHEIALGFLAICSFLIFLLTGNINGFKEFLFFIMILSGSIYARTIPDHRQFSSSNYILYLYLIVASVETLFPEFSEFKSLFLTRSHISDDTLRGVSSLSTEPSFFALTIFSIWLIIASSSNYSYVPKGVLTVMLACLLLSKSSMIFLVMPLLLLSLNNRNLIYTSMAFCVLMLFAFVAFDLDLLISTRATQLLYTLFNSDSNLATDASASSRLYYILKDFTATSELSYFPIFNGMYELVTPNISFSNINISSDYDITLSGSLLGRFFVEFGIIFVFFLCYLFFKMLYKYKTFRIIFIFIFIFAIYAQMISLIFAPIAFSFGVFIYNSTSLRNNNLSMIFPFKSNF